MLLTCAEASQNLNELCQDPQFGDMEWDVLFMAESIAIIFQVQFAREMTPPPSMHHIHDKFILSMETFYEAMGVFTECMEKYNPAKLAEANGKVDEALQYMDETLKLLEEYKVSPTP